MTKDNVRRIIKDALAAGRLPGGYSISAIPLNLRVLLQDAQVEIDNGGQIVIYTGRLVESETPL
jgi:hypothetical protein